MDREEYLQQEVYRLSRILTVQGWAIGRLKILIEMSSDKTEYKYPEEEMKNVLSELNKTLNLENKKGDELRGKLFDTSSDSKEGE